MKRRLEDIKPYIRKLHFWPVWSMEDMIAMGKKFGEILELKKSPDCWLMYIKK